MKKTAPLVVFVFPREGAPTSTRYGGFAKRLQKAGGLDGCEVLAVALENLVFVIEESGEADVIDAVTGQSLGEASLVYLKSWEALPEEASALANFLFYKGIPFMDTAPLGVGVSKIATAFRLWGNGIAVPFTVYARRHDRLLAFLDTYKQTLGERFVLKDANGAKGKINFFVTQTEVPRILKEYEHIQFVAQRFIPNDGDYRIGVYAGAARFVIKRVGSGETHLNNTSAGGTASYLPVGDMPADILLLAEEASAAVELQISGADVIIDKETKKPYVLEVNQGSQIVTGAFTEQNIQAFNEALKDAIKHRYARVHRKPTVIVGRRSVAKLPELGITRAVAKIDTGAYSSTLHAENIRVEEGAGGKQTLVFDVVPNELLETNDATPITHRIDDFFIRSVRSSNGTFERRYSFKTKISLQHREFEAVLTLSDRSEMRWPLLIGRGLLRSRFLVNVELNEHYRA